MSKGVRGEEVPAFVAIEALGFKGGFKFLFFSLSRLLFCYSL